MFDAPDIDTVISLYMKTSFMNLFYSTKEQTELFGNVLIQKAIDILTSKERLSKVLQEITKIPDELHNKSIKAFSLILLHFIELPLDPHTNQEENCLAFCEELTHENHFSIEEIISVIHALVKSNQRHIHEIFLHLLVSNFYEIWWEKLGKDQHISILSKWITVMLMRTTTSRHHVLLIMYSKERQN